jgi:hypothetical protein
VKKVFEYRLYAKECRALAERLKAGDGRERLLEVAAAWERLATERERRFVGLFDAA